MYEIIKNVITSGRFELSDMLTKIDTIWLHGNLTDLQRTELVGMARENAIPENSYANVQRQLNSIFLNLTELAAAIRANADAIAILQGGEADPAEEEEYPLYVQPTGAHDAYNTGDKVTYNGKHYTCLSGACVWNPDVYPDYWELTE